MSKNRFDIDTIGDLKKEFPIEIVEREETPNNFFYLNMVSNFCKQGFPINRIF